MNHGGAVKKTRTLLRKRCNIHDNIRHNLLFNKKKEKIGYTLLVGNVVEYIANV